ncbi:hypothetical protein Bca101_034693 [Brassica carinata]
MVWCKHCAKEVVGIRPDDCALACNRCGRILENFYFSEEVTFIKNAAGQSQASGNIVSSVQSGIPSSRARRSRIARDELMNLRDALQIGEDRDDVVNMASRLFDTGRKPSGICGAAIYIAALSRGIMCSTTDIVEELDKSEESILLEKPFTPRPNSDKEVVNCKHKDSESFGYGLCRDCHEKFMKVSGGVVGGSDPPAFQRAEKERMEKAAREENEGGIEKSVRGETYWNAEDSDESDNLSDLDGDPVVDGCFLDEDEKRAVKKSWEFLNADWLKEQAAKEAALKTASDAFNASNANCPEYARNLVEASKASVSKSRKEKRQKRAEEAKNAPPAATALEACTRVLESKKLIKHFNPDRLKELFNPDRLKELFDTSSGEKSPKKSRTETVIENKKEVEIEEEEDEEEDEEQSYEMYAEEKFYEDQEEEEEEEEEDGYDFGL